MNIFQVPIFAFLFITCGCSSYPNQAVYQTNEVTRCEEIDSLINELTLGRVRIHLDGDEFLGTGNGRHEFYTGPDISGCDHLNLKENNIVSSFNTLIVLSGRIVNRFGKPSRWIYLYSQKLGKDSPPHLAGLVVSDRKLPLKLPHTNRNMDFSYFVPRDFSDGSSIEFVTLSKVVD